MKKLTPTQKALLAHLATVESMYTYALPGESHKLMQTPEGIRSNVATIRALAEAGYADRKRVSYFHTTYTINEAGRAAL